MNFAVEETASISDRERKLHAATPGSPIAPTGRRDLPKTGDETDILPYCAAALISGIVLLVIGLSALKKNRKETEAQV